MSAADRARLARAARAILGAETQAGPARCGSLRRLSSVRRREPCDFDDLQTVPDWLPADPAARRGLAIRTGLAAVSPALSRTLDGATLRGFAAQAGDDLVDWALKLGARADAPTETPPLHPEAIETLGNAIIGTALSLCLQGRFPEAPPLQPDHISWSLDRAREVHA